MYFSQWSIYHRKLAADSFLLMVWTTPSKFIMRPLLDSEKSASSDFTSLKQKNVCRSCFWQIGWLADRFLPSPPFEALEWGSGIAWVVVLSRKSALGRQYWTCQLENRLGRSQSLLDGSCVDSFAAGLSKCWRRHQPGRRRSFLSFWLFLSF